VAVSVIQTIVSHAVWAPPAAEAAEGVCVCPGPCGRCLCPYLLAGNEGRGYPHGAHGLPVSLSQLGWLDYLVACVRPVGAAGVLRELNGLVPCKLQSCVPTLV
ncbi:uncharacterized protein METZ01_LOCUS120631, partial [marine metagenome]